MPASVVKAHFAGPSYPSCNLDRCLRAIGAKTYFMTLSTHLEAG